MNKFLIFIILTHFFCFSCESIPPPPDFEAEPVSVSTEKIIEVEAHTAVFFPLFTPQRGSLYAFCLQHEYRF